jgi:hypothetical protein
MICTDPLAVSKARSVARVGESVISPGVKPAEISETRARVSVLASTILKPPAVNEELTSCETKTRVLNLLGGPL